MNDYIKREDAQRALVHTLKDAEIDTAFCNEQDWYCQGLMDAGEAIDAVPTADVVEVVRCKDCKWSEVKPYGCEKYLICNSQDIWWTLDGDTEGIDEIEVEKNHYCSYGERKE